MSNYRYGNISKLPSDEKIEILTFIAKTKNSNNRELDKSESYESMREKQRDEYSRIIELRKLDEGGLKFGYQDLISSVEFEIYFSPSEFGSLSGKAARNHIMKKPLKGHSLQGHCLYPVTMAVYKFNRSLNNLCGWY